MVLASFPEASALKDVYTSPCEEDMWSNPRTQLPQTLYTLGTFEEKPSDNFKLWCHLTAMCMKSQRKNYSGDPISHHKHEM